MIVVIDGLNAAQFTGLLNDVFALRKRVFHDRLGWDVVIENGQERDHFDAQNPTHIVSLNDAGKVVGCMRLLQTTGPNMLADVFSSIMQGEPAPRSPLIWEATRFCVDTEALSGGKTRNSISYVTSEVMIAAFEYAQAAGVQDAVAVIDPVMNRVLKRSGNAPYDYLGAPTPMGKVTAMAALMDCSNERIASVRDFSGITGDVVLSEAQALALYSDAALSAAQELDADAKASANSGPLSNEEVIEYCLSQIEEAKTEEELRCAVELLHCLDRDLQLGSAPGAATHVITS